MPQTNASQFILVTFRMQTGVQLTLLLTLTIAVVYGETGFFLSTRRVQENPQQVEAKVEALVRSSFYAADPAVLAIPRWLGNISSPEISAVVSARLQQQDSNIFSVDLSEASDETEIIDSVASLVIVLNNQFDVPLDRILVVGFAEGVHLAGGVAAKVQQELGRQLSQITALDPSSGEELDHKLSQADAEFVEVVHTNSGGLGTWEQLGHVDYYPNGGQTQPGCSTDSCSHERAFELLAEMWSPENDFVSARCGTVESLSASSCRWSTHKMGQKGDEQHASGIYFLETRQSSPFSRGAYFISFL
ncbi:pancreatic lipase-related protein 3 [Drosophila santomea]|uniref:pancreatic lipase-related protein 3 n=1 Tax=Drosophila santomea TaxID=129105 RepID=UPI001953A719|nr:pancreatic lipase-related protein 3 [Drosophila santomea]